MEHTYDIEAIDAELEKVWKAAKSDNFSDLANAVSAARAKLDEPLQLAIIGKISSSKSTLVNAILGKEEVMTTGQMEVTYNVGWLKYGLPESEIIIHHKDGSPDLLKSPQEFTSWSLDDRSKRELIDNVSYIETFDDAEILREINIIDTPGLDAVRGQDSKNTLDFLNKVRPDAVIMMFTHSVAESTLDVVREFNKGGDFNPLNAVGILSKIDVLWMEDCSREDSALQIGKRIAENKMKSVPALRKTLFNIYPISSLLFLKSRTIGNDILEQIRRLAGSDEDMLSCAMLSAQDFLDEDYALSIGMEEREFLLKNLDLYGISLLIDLFRKNSDAALDDAKKLLFEESGAKEFISILHNHFGNRSKLIKLESTYQHLQHVILTERGKLDYDADRLRMLDTIAQQVSDTFSSLVHEHQEYELLNKIYHNDICLDKETENEFIQLCGESGYSAPERLGLEDATIEQLKEKVSEREKYWRRAINEEFDPDEKEWMNVILQSYILLKNDISVAAYQYENAKSFLFKNCE